MYQKEITHLLVQIFKTTIGKGPSLVRINISENIIIADIKGAFTVLEQTLLKQNLQNMALVRVIRNKLMEMSIENFSTQLQDITNQSSLKVLNYSIEIDQENDRQIIVFVCNMVIASQLNENEN